MDQQVQSNKKTASTNSLYQSTFMPLFQNAETQIKKLLIYYFWLGKSKSELRMQINRIIEQTDSRIPKDLEDRESYIRGLYRSSEKLITQTYDSAMLSFLSIKSMIRINTPQEVKNQQRRPLDITSPKQLMEILRDDPKKIQLNMWSEAKAAVRVQNYNKEINKFLNGVNRHTMVSSEVDGKHPISLWQKAELQTRYKNQMQMLQDLRAKDVKLAWISSHPDCSKRCEKWQGELVSLNEHTGNAVDNKSPKSSFYLYTKDGHKVYSLPDIMSVTDDNGWHNNIINGFNCRHHLIPYKPGSEKPNKYDEKDVAKQRDIESKIRAMERDIRSMKEKEQGLLITGQKKEVIKLHKQIVKAVDHYKYYCNKNGYAWEKYRIDI